MGLHDVSFVLVHPWSYNAEPHGPRQSQAHLPHLGCAGMGSPLVHQLSLTRSYRWIVPSRKINLYAVRSSSLESGLALPRFW